ncbi:MAG: ATP-binding protein [Mucilaginibacter sp.]|uniref:sensor histidine kinase n=1 Tax=Mucilaginibacter sp. TaxID=1882438 RepID=UPI0034E3A64F
MSLTTSPASLLFTLAEHDQRIFFAINPERNSFIYVNPAFKTFFKTDAEDLSPYAIYNLVNPEDSEYLKESYFALQPGTFKNNIEFRIQLPHQEERVLRLGLLLQPQENEGNLLLGYMEDISDFKAYNDKLNEFSNKKNSILNILSHDLAGPLGSIQNLSALINRKTKAIEDPEVKKWLSLIEEISKKSVLMIQEFVKKEFIESVGVALFKKRANLTQIFKSMAEEYQQKQEELSQTFIFNTVNKPIFVEIDESKFSQAINNLISNSIKFTPNGGTITLSLEDRGTTVRIIVADNGIGIPKKFHASLFDKFNNASRVGLKGEPSVGLGMSIIKTIIEWHDGKIWFESEENKGTTFYVEIAKV